MLGAAETGRYVRKRMSIGKTLQTAFGYIVRFGKINFVTNRKSDTLILFIHGIVSQSESAFKLSITDGYFWDLLKDKYHFSNIDFAEFNYGIADPAYILTKLSPFNNLEKIANELHYQIRDYANVVIIGHSQGGLLAKTYAILYKETHSTFIITLHTPHINRSILVFRNKMDMQWEKGRSYEIPHIFAGSVCDNKIVKCNNALSGCTDFSYVSRDTNKKQLGHSHLSTHPDSSLLKLIERQIIFFTNSGFNTRPIYKRIKYINSHPSIKTVKLYYSSSNSELESLLCNTDIRKNIIIRKFWNNKYYDSGSKFISIYKKYFFYDNKKDVLIYCNAKSVDFFKRHILNLPDCKCINFQEINLNRYDQDLYVVANDYLCEIMFSSNKYDHDNPYSDLPIDPGDFNKKYFINNYDFLKILSKLILSNRLNIRRVYRRKDVEQFLEKKYKKRLSSIYMRSIEKYKFQFLLNIYNNCLDDYDIRRADFVNRISNVIINLLSYKSSPYSYIEIYREFKFYFKYGNQNISIKELECCISKIFERVGNYYRLTRDVRLLFTVNKHKLFR